MFCLLKARDCYIGQRVFWVMWIDQKQSDESFATGSKYKGYYRYKPGLSPELWDDVVDKVTKNGHVGLRQFGKAREVYSCEIDAVRGAYQSFCYGLGVCVVYPSSKVVVPLSESARVLNLLSEIEDGCHVRKAAIDAKEATHGR